MKNFGILLIVVGVIWGIYAFNMETSITTEGKTIGAGLYSAYIPSQTIHNLDLASRRQNHLIGAGVLFISGIILFGFGTLQPKPQIDKVITPPLAKRRDPVQKASSLRCPFCNAEVTNRSATICHYCNKAYDWA